MITISLSALRSNLPSLVRRAQQGERIAITVHGKPVAELGPNRIPGQREAALQRLAAQRGTVITGDVLAPLADSWSADADHL
ncbi:MAG: type II toxin-antitoxin system prevent-host-death family antitoxin [Burkholderiales bacterium]|jgi:prevent-host-death family protein|nr:type II toxin-antitoxin system prevent-host-death family antitoxin [Burkholderiales bacterium]